MLGSGNQVVTSPAVAWLVEMGYRSITSSAAKDPFELMLAKGPS